MHLRVVFPTFVVCHTVVSEHYRGNMSYCLSISNLASCFPFFISSIVLFVVLVIVLAQVTVIFVSVIWVVKAAGPVLSAVENSDKHGIDRHVREA